MVIKNTVTDFQHCDGYGYFCVNDDDAYDDDDDDDVD